MTNAEKLDWLYRLKSEIYVYMPKEWLIPMNNALDEAIKTLEHETCEDAISRQAVLDYIKGSEAELGHSTENDLVCEDIMNLPPVEPKREHGKWELVSEDEFITEYRCSRCYEQSLISVNKILYKRPTHNFCPNCGADMRGES